ncbi:hypothetical protein C8J57DRAFT_1222284 [Mycena rebaudengoi]|nr:hypothetical protein C8J57DRAFT_1222284 [Mycena rebaudengoi]
MYLVTGYITIKKAERIGAVVVENEIVISDKPIWPIHMVRPAGSKGQKKAAATQEHRYLVWLKHTKPATTSLERNLASLRPPYTTADATERKCRQLMNLNRVYILPRKIVDWLRELDYWGLHLQRSLVINRACPIIHGVKLASRGEGRGLREGAPVGTPWGAPRGAPQGVMLKLTTTPIFIFNYGIYFGNPKIYQRTILTTTTGEEDIKEEGICLETDRNDRFPDEPIWQTTTGLRLHCRIGGFHSHTLIQWFTQSRQAIFTTDLKPTQGLSLTLYLKGA